MSQNDRLGTEVAKIDLEIRQDALSHIHEMLRVKNDQTFDFSIEINIPVHLTTLILSLLIVFLHPYRLYKRDECVK